MVNRLGGKEKECMSCSRKSVKIVVINRATVVWCSYLTVQVDLC